MSRLTAEPYWLEVPSKQSTITRDWGTESVDMVVVREKAAAPSQLIYNVVLHIGGRSEKVAVPRQVDTGLMGLAVGETPWQ